MVNITNCQKTQPFKLLFKMPENCLKRIRWGRIGNKRDFKGEFLIKITSQYNL